MIQETAIAPVSSAAVLAFRALACGPTRPPSSEGGPKCHTERVRSELDRSRALWECIGSPNYSFEFTMLYDWPKSEPPGMELAKTFDAMFDRFKILGFSAKYDDTLGYPTTMVECNDGFPTINHVRIDGYQVVNTPPPPPPTPHPREELVRNLTLWEARGSDDYSFEFQRSCMCPPEHHMPVRITVRDGAVDSAAFTRPALVWG